MAIKLKRRYNCKYTIEEEQKILDLYAEGSSSNEIGKSFFMTGKGIIKILKAYGVSIRTNSESHKGRFDPLDDRFWGKIKKQTSGCWEWKGNISSSGYGLLSYKGKNIGSHILSWILHNGEIENNLWVLHKCDNRKCVNPKHLFLGTRQDNMDDMVRKGRQKNGPNSPQVSGGL